MKTNTITNIRTTLTPDESRAFKHWCVDNDITATRVVTDHIRKLIKKNKSQQNQAQFDQIEEISDIPLDNK